MDSSAQVESLAFVRNMDSLSRGMEEKAEAMSASGGGE